MYQSAVPYLGAEAGFEPRDLRVMSPTSYQAALLRDIKLSVSVHTPNREMVPVTGVEPVRDCSLTGF